jgi:YidC/Oxa1 family membrane protein insertase
MNRNTIIGLVLIFGIFILWSQWMSPPEEDATTDTEATTSQDTAQDTPVEEKVLPPVQQAAIPAPAEAITDTTSDLHRLKAVYGPFVKAGTAEEELIVVENDLMKVLISTRGGMISSVELSDYQTYDSLPLILLGADSTRFGFSFMPRINPDPTGLTPSPHINTADLVFEVVAVEPEMPAGEPLRVSGSDSVRLLLRLYADAPGMAFDPGKYFEYTYTIYGDQYMLDYGFRVVGLNQDITPTSRPDVLQLNWQTYLRRQEKTQDRLSGTTIYYREVNEKVHYLSESDSDSEIPKDHLQWVSFKQRFFSSSLINRTDFFKEPVLAHYTLQNHPDPRYLKSMKVSMEVPIQSLGNSAADFSFYFGPLKYKTLRSYKLDLERQIPLGWSFAPLAWINRYAVIPVFDWLGGYGWNYGIVILVLTIMLKIVLFPIAYRTYKSSAKMRVLKPEIDEIAKKFPKKEDAMKKQQATMALYKQAGVNPMAGCVPMLLQFPILIALFRFFPSSIELRQQAFLWAHDLSSYDSVASLPFEIPFYGDHVSLFTLLMTISTVIYTWMNNQMMSSSQQMPGMKTMMYLMPVMFLGIFNNYASGLSYYYLLANLFTFGQMFVIRRTIDEDKIHRKIQEHKKKPKKQSGFQKRLEDAAKKRYNPPKKKK